MFFIMMGFFAYYFWGFEDKQIWQQDYFCLTWLTAKLKLKIKSSVQSIDSVQNRLTDGFSDSEMPIKGKGKFRKARLSNTSDVWGKK